jgi:hypothetical protein
MVRPPLGLIPEVVDPNGTRYRWDSVSARDTPQSFGFRTLRGTGFADMPGLTLARRIDQDYADVQLLHDFNLIGEEGSVAYEGRISADPRSFDAGHTITPQAVGWMAHAQDEKFADVFVDSDFGAWTEMPLNRRIALAGAVSTGDISWSTTTLDGLVCALPNSALATQVAAETWYTAPPGVKLAKIMYRGGQSPASNFPNGTTGGYSIGFGASDVDSGGSEGYTPTLDGAIHTANLTTDRRYVFAQVWSNGAARTPAVGAMVHFARLAMYGSNAIARPALTAGEPDGVFVSDVVRSVFSRYCPRIRLDGVLNTTYPVRQLAYKDRISPFDALLDMNKWHLWLAGVWENKTLHYGPADLTDYDWEVRLGDLNTKVELQGDTTETIANGIVVQFTNAVTGLTDWITPDDTPELADESVENPVNAHGLRIWLEFQVTFPCLPDDAVQIGRAALAEANQPSGSGTITVSGWIKDRAGNLQPTWKVRSHDRIAITDHANARPRAIVETNYQHGQGGTAPTVQISVDSTLKRLDAYLDRVVTSLSARNIT